MVAAIRNAEWYAHFPENYLWSYNVLLVLSVIPAGGAEIGEVDRVCRRLAGHVGDNEAWFREWRAMGDHVRGLGEKAEALGDGRTAIKHYRRATSYYFAAERFRFPKDADALDAYRAMTDVFRRAAELDDRYRIEYVDVPYEGASLPAVFVSAAAQGERAPAVLFMSGFDGNKEHNWFLAAEELLARGVSVLSLDSPGVGEAIRFRDIPLRYDYEVAGSAAVDWLQGRDDVDPERIGVLALSLGGYYSSRCASMEPRFAACAAWGAIWDYHRIWTERIEAAYAKQLPVPGDHLVYATGTSSTDEALKVLEGFRLADVVPRMRCPFLLVHGEDDQQVPLSDAHLLFDAVGSEDKTLRIFTGEEGAAQHCQMDNLSIAVPEITRWLADRLGAR